MSILHHFDLKLGLRGSRFKVEGRNCKRPEVTGQQSDTRVNYPRLAGRTTITLLDRKDVGPSTNPSEVHSRLLGPPMSLRGYVSWNPDSPRSHPGSNDPL